MDNLEIFVDVLGFEGLYEVSNYGNVKSLPKGNGNGNRTRILKKEVRANGATNYNRVTLCKNSTTKRFFVHRLVAIHFIPNEQKKPCVNHIDNNGENNNVNNLEWCTAKENKKHSMKQGRHFKALKLATEKASDRAKEKTTQKAKSLLGDRFICTEKKNQANMIVFNCLCGAELKRRSNSVVVKRGGICSKCAS